MKNKLNWNILSNKERNRAINEIKEIILSNGAYILSSNFFSDLAISLCLGIEEKNIGKLHAALKREMDVSELDAGIPGHHPGKEWLVFLNIRFSKGSGDLKVEVPDVPG